MNRDDVIRMALEAGVHPEYTPGMVEMLTSFAALVAAAERNRAWTQEHWTEYERSIAAAEREACARVCDGKEREKWEQMAKVLTGGLGEIHPIGPKECAAAIRARGQA